MASTLDIVGPDSPFIDALLKASEFRRNLVEQGHASADSSDALTTNRGQLAQLVNICFWTSLAAEEGRPVRGVVAVCSRQPSPTATGLVTPRPCSTSDLVALLTAAGDAAVAVHAGLDGPEVWGFVDRAALPMHALRLRVGGTGTVIASLQSRVVAILSHGRVDIPANASWLDLAQLVSNTLDRGEPFEKRLVRAERLLQIVAAMHQHGHGGGVVVTPPDGASPADMNIKYALDADGAKIVQERVAMFESAARDSQLLEDAWMHGQPFETPQPQWNLKAETKKVTRRLLDTALRHVGHLSSVDGAVVVDEQLRVVGFGAKLTAQHAEFQVAEWDAVSGSTRRSVSPAELGGTRHQSAARYVFHHHQCMCFVASQDGRLSLFAWLEKDRSVVFIRRLEHFIWEHE